MVNRNIPAQQSVISYTNLESDLTPDLAPDLTPDLAPDLASDLAPDLAPDLILLDFCIEPQDRVTIMKQIGLKNIQKNADRYIHPLIEKGYLEMTIPGKPNSRLQKYVITEFGKQHISR